MQIVDLDMSGPYIPLLLHRELDEFGTDVYDIVVVAGEAANIYREHLRLEDVITHILTLWKETPAFISCNDAGRTLRVSDFISLPAEFLHRYGVHLIQLPKDAICTLSNAAHLPLCCCE